MCGFLNDVLQTISKIYDSLILKLHLKLTSELNSCRVDPATISYEIFIIFCLKLKLSLP